MDDKIKILNNCMRYAGINQQTTKEDYIFLMEFFESQFPNISYMQLQEAFKENAQNEFLQLEAYQNFSPMLIGKVIKAYKEVRRKKNLIKKTQPIALIENKISIEDQQKEDFEFIERRFKSGLPIDGFNFSGAFKYLERIGEINLTNEEKKELLKEIISKKREEINSKHIKSGFKDASMIDQLRPLSLKIECRKTAVIDYLKNKL